MKTFNVEVSTPPIPRFYRDIPGTRSKEDLSLKDLMRVFDPMESMRMAYVPIIMTQAAFRYAELVCRYCADHHLNYRNQTRAIKEAIGAYQSTTLAGIHLDTLNRLRSQINEFCDVTSHDVQTLWFVVNGNLKKHYPELEDYELLTLVYCTLCIMVYVRRFEDASDQAIRERLSLSNCTTRNEHLTKASQALFDIAGKYDLNRDDAVNLSMQIIANKLDAILQPYLDDK